MKSEIKKRRIFKYFFKVFYNFNYYVLEITNFKTFEIVILKEPLNLTHEHKFNCY